MRLSPNTRNRLDTALKNYHPSSSIGKVHTKKSTFQLTTFTATCVGSVKSTLHHISNYHPGKLYLTILLLFTLGVEIFLTKFILTGISILLILLIFTTNYFPILKERLLLRNLTRTIPLLRFLGKTRR